MAYFQKEFINQVLEANPIEEVINEYVSLTKKSGRNQFGLCPFHAEKTPSFSVSAEKQYFHCFGCKKSGNVIEFIKEIEHLDYKEAVVYLAKRVNISIPAEGGNFKSAKYEQEKKELKKLNAEAANYYYRLLRKKEGALAAKYLKSRGYRSETANSFALGYADKSYDGLVKYFQNKYQGKFPKAQLLKLGLIKEKNNHYYDAFRDRLIFPILNSWQEVIAFGARRLDSPYSSLPEKETKENQNLRFNPKYLNSPESPLYHKGENLYAFHIAKKSQSDSLIIVEGYMDALALHAHGFSQTVAVLGTAFTAKQLNILKKLQKKIILAFDQDEAGKEATFRALSMLVPTNMEVSILKLEKEKDPDEFILKNGILKFQQVLKQLKSPIEFIIDYYLSKYQTDFGKDIHASIKDILAWLKASNYSAVKTEETLQNLAARFNIPYTVLKEDFQKTISSDVFVQNSSHLLGSNLKEARKTGEPSRERDKILAANDSHNNYLLPNTESNPFLSKYPAYKEEAGSFLDINYVEKLYQNLIALPKQDFLYKEEAMVFHLYLREKNIFEQAVFKISFSDFLSPLSRHFAQNILGISDDTKVKIADLGLLDENKEFNFPLVINWANEYVFYQGNLAEILLKLQTKMENYRIDSQTCTYWILKLLLLKESNKIESILQHNNEQVSESDLLLLKKSLDNKQMYQKELEKLSYKDR